MNIRCSQETLVLWKFYFFFFFYTFLLTCFLTAWKFSRNFYKNPQSAILSVPIEITRREIPGVPWSSIFEARHYRRPLLCFYTLNIELRFHPLLATSSLIAVSGAADGKVTIHFSRIVKKLEQFYEHWKTFFSGTGSTIILIIEDFFFPLYRNHSELGCTIFPVSLDTLMNVKNYGSTTKIQETIIFRSKFNEMKEKSCRKFQEDSNHQDGEFMVVFLPRRKSFTLTIW